ncbi:hypothetical protein RND71_018608 [Anisodus tanguticus]|uniref:Uncharacterized protein n=1 Tax=Anisodus tanguticus TaxID=243964 RepID=A0AAE1VC79_9SOLA|nr:hypothetical protein RND71_018608 [Anisodus tanguticus]
MSHFLRNVIITHLEKKPPRVFTPLMKSQTQLYERLKNARILHPVEAKSVNPSANWYNPNKSMFPNTTRLSPRMENSVGSISLSLSLRGKAIGSVELTESALDPPFSLSAKNRQLREKKALLFFGR